MDSIYKGYPFGSLLFWRTKNALKSDRKLGPFELPERPDDFPVEYVLDGQQRLTSIFGVFQTELVPDDNADWTDIYFDLRSHSDVQESRFLPLTEEEVDPARHFPLSVLYDSKAYGTASRTLPENDIEVIDDLWTRFKECDVPVQTFNTDDRAGVAIVFERVNRLGVELDTLQLLSAWTWSEDFNLQEKFAGLAEDFEPFGFQGVGEDITLLLRCCAAVVEGDASPNTLMQLNGGRVRDAFPQIHNGLRGAIDFVKKELSVEKLDNLPQATLLVPLTVFFAAEDNESVKVTDDQRTTLLRWFWRACFASRYGRVVQRNLKTDVEQVQKLKRGDPNSLDDIAAQVDANFFLDNSFNLKNVATKTYVLMLAQHSPRSLVGGRAITLSDVLARYNRNEFHHLYPQSYLRESGVPTVAQSPLANMCFISAIDNKVLGGRAPSVYRSSMAKRVEKVLEGALVPIDELFADDYDAFLPARSAILAKAAERFLH